VIGVKKRENGFSSPDLIKHNPTLGTVFSTLLNAVLLDGIDTDLHLLEKTNLLVDTVEETSRAQLPIRFVETLMITPSEDIGAIALEEMAALPQMLHYLLGGWGTERETAELASYLFFEPAFCIRLLQLGKKDAMARSAEIENILLLKGNKQQDRRAS
jgi:NTE family protein